MAIAYGRSQTLSGAIQALPKYLCDAPDPSMSRVPTPRLGNLPITRLCRYFMHQVDVIAGNLPQSSLKEQCQRHTKAALSGIASRRRPGLARLFCLGALACVRKNRRGIEARERLRLLLKEFGMRQRLAWDHLFAHCGVIDEDRLPPQRSASGPRAAGAHRCPCWNGGCVSRSPGDPG